MTSLTTSPHDAAFEKFSEISTECNFFKQQQESGVKVVESFASGNHYVMISAQPQSGKTGLAKFVAFAVHMNKYAAKLGIKQVVVFSSDNRKHLKAQWEKSWTASREALMTNCKGRAAKICRDVNLKVCLRRTAEFHKLLEAGPGSDTLFIWDESDYGIDSNSRFGKFFEKMGWGECMRTGDQSALCDQNNYIMTVTATRGAELAHPDLTEATVQISMTPGPGYRGIEWFMQEKRILPIEEDFSDLPQIFDSFESEKKIIVVRARAARRSLVQTECQRRGWRCLELNQRNPSVVGPVREWYDDPTSSPCVISLLNFWGRGDDLSLVGVDDKAFAPDEFKSLICAWIETDVPSNSHTFVQRIGRLFGYNTHDTTLYCPMGSDNTFLGEYLEQVIQVTPQMSGGKYTKLRKSHTSTVPCYCEHTRLVSHTELFSDAGSSDDYSPVEVLVDTISRGRTPLVTQVSNVCLHTNLMSKCGLTPAQQTEIRQYLKNPEIMFTVTKPIGHYKRVRMTERIRKSLASPSGGPESVSHPDIVWRKPIIIYYISEEIDGIPEGLLFQFAPKRRPIGKDVSLKSEDKRSKSLFAKSSTTSSMENVDEEQPENRIVESFQAACSWDYTVLLQEMRDYRERWGDDERGAYAVDLTLHLDTAYGSNLSEIKRFLKSDEFKGCEVVGKQGRSRKGEKRIKFKFRDWL